MEPPPYSCFFSPFTRVFPEWTAAVFTTCSQSPPLDEHQDHVYSFNVRLAVLFVVYYCFNNTKGTDRDYLVIHITAGLVTLWSRRETLPELLVYFGDLSPLVYQKMAQTSGRWHLTDWPRYWRYYSRERCFKSQQNEWGTHIVMRLYLHHVCAATFKAILIMQRQNSRQHSRELNEICRLNPLGWGASCLCLIWYLAQCWQRRFARNGIFWNYMIQCCLGLTLTF